MLKPESSPICLDHIPVARTIYSHSIVFLLTITPNTFPFFFNIFSTGDFSNILTPSFLAAFANKFVYPIGSACPSPGIKIPPRIFFSLIIGYIFFI